MDIRSMVGTGIREPGRILPYLRYRLQQRRYRHRVDRVDEQVDLLHELVDRDRFLLVLLDACRYDAFEEVAGAHLSGDLSHTHTVAGKTALYLNRTWTERDRYELTYVSANPQITDRAQRLRGFDYRPSERFRETVDVWNDHWDTETGTVPPEPVTKAALERLETGTGRLVVHYMQPHSPFVGEGSPLHARDLDASDPRIADAVAERGHWRETAERGDPLAASGDDRIRPTDHLHELYDAGEIDGSDLWPAYRANLERALEAVRDLVTRVDPRVPVVVSADHGEMLDDVPERGFGHPDEFHPAVRDVPWFRVDPAMQGTVDDPYGDDIDRTDTATRNVEERLRHLGYLRE